MNAVITEKDERMIERFVTLAAAINEYHVYGGYTGHELRISTIRRVLYEMSPEAKEIALNGYALEFGKEWSE